MKPLDEFRIQNVYLYFDNSSHELVSTLAKDAENEFKELLREVGYGGEVVDKLWKWYDFTQKKGVASF